MSEQEMKLGDWQPIETCPQTGYFLVHEDGAVRLRMRFNGEWSETAYPALMSTEWWGGVLVGKDAARVLQPLGYELKILDGCVESPTHWMHCPESPEVEEGEDDES